MVVRPEKLGALLQSVKDTPRSWQDRVPAHEAVQSAVPGAQLLPFDGKDVRRGDARFYPN
jgi:hypothetical protein